MYRKHYGGEGVAKGGLSVPSGGAPAAAPAGGGFKPPPGAIPRQYQGKTYYYDPNSKQPYPGQ
jgi:hypothetical protein